jgi:hypothetical protein
MRGRFGRRRTRRRQTTYRGTVGLGAGALALVATISLLLLLRRRAMRNGSSTEEVNEAPKTREAKRRSDQEEVSAEGNKEYFRKLIEESNKRSGLKSGS